MSRHSAFALALLLTAGPVFGEGFRLVGNPGIRISSLPRATVAVLFLKKAQKLSDGTHVVVVDQSDKNAARTAFTATVYGKPVDAIKSYWRQQIFSGRDLPPVEKASDDEVLEYVRNTPGAIGYVSDTAAVGGLKTIEVR